MRVSLPKISKISVSVRGGVGWVAWGMPKPGKQGRERDLAVNRAGRQQLEGRGFMGSGQQHHPAKGPPAPTSGAAVEGPGAAAMCSSERGSQN